MSRYYKPKPEILTIVVASGISGVVVCKLFDRNDPFSYKAITHIFKERLPSAVREQNQNVKYEEINRIDYDELKKHTNRKH